MDAILVRNPGQPLSEPEWPETEFIVGNPPFLGDKLMRRELDDEYVDELRAHYKGRIPGQSDLCCYWFEKARAHIESGTAKRAGLLATQGIRGGANRKCLERIQQSGNIFFAIADREWFLDGANVHISMVGFDDGREIERSLNGQTVPQIHPNLTSESNLGSGSKIQTNSGIGWIGVAQKANFDPGKTVVDWLAEPNPHGRPNSDVQRIVLNAMDLTRRPSWRWNIDFAVMEEITAALYHLPFEWVRHNVRPGRENHREAIRAKKWWLFARPSAEMRASLIGLPRYLATPRVSKHRIFAWLGPEIIPDSALTVFARSDDYFFGVLHSRIHEIWALGQGTQLREKESGFRYTPTTCFETFPFPFAGDTAPEDPLQYVARLRAAHYHFGQDNVVREEPPPVTPHDHRAAIAAAARDLNDQRERWLNPPEWTREEILEFPATPDGPWAHFVAPGTTNARWPRRVAIDAAHAAKLAKRTLTNLYNERPAWLAHAHAALDAAVAAAYGWPTDLTNEEILARLLERNRAAT